ncbi:MAG: transporter substrate-binding domain-containing protein [Gammaproteobacteria bacterium]|nr:transporter substrate-binding domain-containing protein [Gammaproteobacteria bacterium]
MNRGWTRLAGLMGIAGALLASSLARADPIAVYYPRPSEGSPAMVSRYPVELLERALAVQGRFQAKPTPQAGSATRNFEELAKPSGAIDLLWSMSTPEREARYRPVRFPLDRGLMGWRLLLIHRDQAVAFSRVRDARDLRAFTAGQGESWLDSRILKANDLPLVTVSKYRLLFAMLEHKRFDYFPRAALEIGDELARENKADFLIEPNLVLHYPTAYYYLVNRRSGALARDLESGLQTLKESGEFQRIFARYHATALQAAELRRRTRIELENPFLPTQGIDLKDPIWYRP